MPISLISLLRFVRGNIERVPRTAMSPGIPIFTSFDSPAEVLFRRSRPTVKALRVALSDSDGPAARDFGWQRSCNRRSLPIWDDPVLLRGRVVTLSQQSTAIQHSSPVFKTARPFFKSGTTVKLRFADLTELIAHTTRIDSANHWTTGNWTAAQNFYHLAGAFEGSVQGLPAGYPWAVRMILRPLRSFVTRYRFPSWLPIPAAIKHRLEPPSDLCFESQKSRLLEAIDQFAAYGEAHPAHPVLGKMSHQEWIGFHLRHCEHHLSFIELDDNEVHDRS